MNREEMEVESSSRRSQKQWNCRVHRLLLEVRGTVQATVWSVWFQGSFGEHQPADIGVCCVSGSRPERMWCSCPTDSGI